MSQGYNEPSKGQILQFTVQTTTAGVVDLTQFVHCIRVYEDICKSYITAQVIIYDNDNVIETLGIVAGCPSSFKFWSPPNQRVYDSAAFGQNLTVLKLKGEQMPDTLQWQMYYIDLIGSVYYQDKSTNIDDMSFNSSTTGTSDIQRIWSAKLSQGGPLNTISNSIGPLGTDDWPQIVHNNNPFGAIKDIMKKLDDVEGNGNWLLYRDVNQTNLAQLAALFNGVNNIDNPDGSQRYFVQKETWNAAQGNMPWGSGFNDLDIYKAIIIAQMGTNLDDTAGGRGSGVDLAAAGNQVVRTFDIGTGNIGGTPQFAQQFLAAGPLSAVATGTKMAANRIVNSAKQGLNMVTSMVPAGARALAAQANGGPQLTLKVPMQTGLWCTVGQGVFALLTPPTSNKPNPFAYLLSNYWLVIKCCHEIYSDPRESQATTVIQTVFPSANFTS